MMNQIGYLIKMAKGFFVDVPHLFDSLTQHYSTDEVLRTSRAFAPQLMWDSDDKATYQQCITRLAAETGEEVESGSEPSRCIMF